MGPLGGHAPPQAHSYALELAAQVEEKRMRLDADRADRRRGHQNDDRRVDREVGELRAEVEGEVEKQRGREAVVCAREDSLARFMAEHGSGATDQPSSAPAVMRRPPAGGRAQSQPPQSNPPPRMPQNAPWASHEQQVIEEQPGRYAKKRQEAAPFALHQDQPTPCRAAARNHGYSSAPFAAHEEQPQICAPRGVGGSPWATDVDAPSAAVGGLPPRAPRAGGVSSNVFAQGSNQNCGNVMTDRASSRVLAPPGGRSSLQLY